MQAVLVMFRSDGERRSFSITRDMTVIGRREDCDLRIPLNDISRKHARLVRDGDTLRLEDLGSSNGTYLNGQRVQETILSPGDSVQLGPVVFVLQIDGYPADEELNPVITDAVEHASTEAEEDDAGPLSPTAQSEYEGENELHVMPGGEEEEPAMDLETLPMDEEPAFEELPEEAPIVAKAKPAAAMKAPVPPPPVPPKMSHDEPLELDALPDDALHAHGGEEESMELLPESDAIPLDDVPAGSRMSHEIAAPKAANGHPADADFDLDTLPELGDEESLELLPEENLHGEHENPLDIDLSTDSHTHPHPHA